MRGWHTTLGLLGECDGRYCEIEEKRMVSDGDINKLRAIEG